MVYAASGRLSDLVLVRMRQRTAEYLNGTDMERRRIAAECRRDSTLSDLAERILSRTIYAQASTRSDPLRELLQNALDASPRGARIDVRSSMTTPLGDRAISVTDHGRGMTRAELLQDLLVPFRSAKVDDPEAIGEHGIGFLSSLEVAPHIEVYSCVSGRAYQLSIVPLGSGPPYADFAFGLAEARPVPSAGTIVRLLLEQPIPKPILLQEMAAVVGFVDTKNARIFVNDELVNNTRSVMRRVARAKIGQGLALGELELYVGRDSSILPRFALYQRGLLVGGFPDPFHVPELALHRDILQAITSAGYGLVVDLPLSVPLTKGRSSVASGCAREVTLAIVSAFERFVLQDVLYDRELLRGVDHRLSAILDRLVTTALSGEPMDIPPPPENGTGKARPCAGPSPREPARTPTVAAPEDVVRFASLLLDAPLFAVSSCEPGAPEARRDCTLRTVIQAHRAGLLRTTTNDRGTRRPGLLYLSTNDPLAQALLRRLSTSLDPHAIEPSAAVPPRPVPRIPRERFEGVSLCGAEVIVAAIEILELIDEAISAAAGVVRSPISVHQDLYGPDEMAHTDGSGISVNLASSRIRALLAAILSENDLAAYQALVDLMLHEKAHVTLASFIPRPNAEHGTTFYRRKDLLRRKLLEAIATGEISDPLLPAAAIRQRLSTTQIPSPEALAAVFGFTQVAA